MPVDPILLDAFNAGDHIGSLEEANRADALTRVLGQGRGIPAVGGMIRPEALVALCEKFALPVVEKPGALFANFPKDHPLYQGTDIKPFWNDMDLAIVVRTRVPWYPPSNRPPNAVVALLDETPHRESMAYQSNKADLYLEGNLAQTLIRHGLVDGHPQLGEV